MSEKARYSPSQLGTFTRCQMQWFWRYAEGIISPPGVAAYLGKAVDESVNQNLSAKMAGSPLPFPMAQEVARDAVVAAWKEQAPRVSEDDKLQTVGDVQDAAIVLAGIHHARIAPLITPIAVQAERQISPMGYDFKVNGYLDVLEQGRIRDTKTTGKKPAPDSVDRGSYADQLTMYDIFEGGGNALVLDYLVNVSKPYQVIIQGQTRTELDKEKLLDRYQRMHMSIEAGIFQPTAADSWVCSAKWCGYFERCPHGDRDAILIPVSGLTRKAAEAADAIDW